MGKNIWVYSSPYLHKADVELLGGVASFEVASDVEVVVFDDAGDDIGRGDTFRPLGGHKPGI